MSSGGGAGAGKAQLQDLTVVKNLDKASPHLFTACASGEHLKKAVLTLRRPTGDRVDYLRYTLNDVLITSLRQGSTPDGRGTCRAPALSGARDPRSRKNYWLTCRSPSQWSPDPRGLGAGSSCDGADGARDSWDDGCLRP